MRWIFWNRLMPLAVHWEGLRFLVNMLGAIGFPGILFDAQYGAALWWWLHHS